VPKKKTVRQDTLIGWTAFFSEDVLDLDDEVMVGFADVVADIPFSPVNQRPHQ
jgi:hypothetical protein